ncbi:RusA family crossover junction endodeoxyribonuclease [Herbaspirillum sp. RV1423]|uniref:RusA family crossover junction endodeoxyribonuclease n=1 Tax=Herbaspirillum sp. RV1423 TaxID=1443993 RepID=UPI0004B6DBD7|nr:RusA family crossover junction endodeoxyribonuclease [Herbaspirillum sp. RV1423]
MNSDNFFYDVQDLRAELNELVERFASAPEERWTSQQITNLLSELLKDTADTAAAERLVPAAGAHPILLTLPYPLSANKYWRPVIINGHSMIVPTKEAKQFKADIGMLCWRAGIRKPLAGRVEVAYRLYPARPQDWQKRMRTDGATWDDSVRCIDLDNAQKVLLDAFKGVVFDDDKWVRRIVAERAEPDADGARVVVTITPLAVMQPQVSLFDEVTA